MRAVTVLMMREAPIWVEVPLQGVNEIVAGELLFLRSAGQLQGKDYLWCLTWNTVESSLCGVRILIVGVVITPVGVTISMDYEMRRLVSQQVSRTHFPEG